MHSDSYKYWKSGFFFSFPNIVDKSHDHMFKICSCIYWFCKKKASSHTVFVIKVNHLFKKDSLQKICFWSFIILIKRISGKRKTLNVSALAVRLVRPGRAAALPRCRPAPPHLRQAAWCSRRSAAWPPDTAILSHPPLHAACFLCLRKNSHHLKYSLSPL